MEQLTKNQAVATSQEAVQNQNEPQLRNENAHNDNLFQGVLNQTNKVNKLIKTQLSVLPKKLFKNKINRNFGMKMLTMTNLSTECLIQLTKLGYDATPFNQILKQNAKREMRLRLGKVTVADVLAA